MLSKVLDQIRKLKTDAETELKKLEDELNTLRAERALTARLPVPQEEFLERVDSLVAPPERFTEQLTALLKPLQASGKPPSGINPLGIDATMQVQGGVVPSFSWPEPGSVTHYALMGLIGDTLRDALLAQAAAMPYPTPVGLPAAQRVERLQQLDREANELQARINSLREQLAAAGVRL